MPVPGNEESTTQAPPPPRAKVDPHRDPGRRYGFNCQYCSSRLEATASIAGQEGHCPTCSQTIIIPILDRHGRLIDPMTGQVVKQDPHPVHAYAAAGQRAPKIERELDQTQRIVCPRCNARSRIEANNCTACGMPFTMEGTTLEATGSGNSYATAGLVLGIVGLVTFCTIIVPPLAVIFSWIALRQTDGVQDAASRRMAIGGLICGLIGSALSLLTLLNMT
jgi:ribosomal protein L40E